MPAIPSTRLQTMAARWMVDRVVLSDVTYATDTRPLSKAAESGDGLMLTDDQGDPILDPTTGAILFVDAPTELAALIRSELVDLVDSQNVRRTVRQLKVWVEDDDGEVTVGQRMTITAAGDATLVGRYGQVIDVERDSIRAARRLTVRLGNDA